MRITKQLAEDLKELIFKKSAEKLDDMVIAHNDMCYDLYISTLPKEVVEAMKKHEKYFCTNNNSIQHRNTRHINSLYVQVKPNKKYSVLDNYSFQCLDHYLLSKEDSEMVLASYNVCEKYRAELRKKQDQLYNTLLGLKTKKKVLDVMPELEMYFPVEHATMNYPMVISPELINAINNQPM